MSHRTHPSPPSPQSPSEVAVLIAEECNSLRDMLVAKNKAYGNSALDPVRIFSKADAREQILVRLDDKLSRLARGEAAGEDVIKDMLGYLILLRVADRIAPKIEASALREATKSVFGRVKP